MHNLSISFPASRANFHFGRDSVPLPVDFEATSSGESPKFVLAFKTLTQVIEVFPSRAELQQIARFISQELKPATAQHLSDE